MFCFVNSDDLATGERNEGCELWSRQKMLAKRSLFQGAGKRIERGLRRGLKAAGANVEKCSLEPAMSLGSDFAHGNLESFHHVLHGPRTKELRAKGSKFLEPSATDRPQKGGRLLPRQAQFAHDQAKTEHRIRRLSTHRVAPQALSRTVARGRARRSPERGNGRAADLKPAMDRYVRSTASVSGFESFVQIEKSTTSFCEPTRLMFQPRFPRETGP